MTEPKRWSDAASDVDPVLRAVMRYAQNIEPSRQDVAACAAAVARVEARAESRVIETQALGRRRWGWGSLRVSFRRPLVWAGAFALVAVAGISLGMTLAPSFSRPPRSVVASARTKPVEAQRGVAAELTVESPAPLPVASAPTSSPPRVVAPASASAAVEPMSELALLTEARKELQTRPARTLLLLAIHQQRFPASSFPEERAALRVEALFGLGRTSEAEREYASFGERFPKSVYAPRLLAARQRR